MSRMKKKSAPTFVMFDVVYEDGTLISNRRIPGDVLEDIFSNDPARAFIESQDSKIAGQSGLKKPKIKSVTRVRAGRKQRLGG